MTILTFQSVGDFLQRFNGIFPGDNFGYVYACEYGKDIKIGSTQHPKQRIKSLESNARIYGNKKFGAIMITPVGFMFYVDFERFLHFIFKDKRKSERGEVFDLTIKEIEPVFVTEFFSFLRFIESEALKTTPGWNVMHKYINHIRSCNV